MQFRYTILYVRNVVETIAFYQRAFGLEKGFVHESGEYGELATGTTTLAFSSFDLIESLGKSPARANHEAPAFEIAFETEDVGGSLKRALDAGAILVQDVREQPWGQTTAYVADDNGVLIEICSPVRSQP